MTVVGHGGEVKQARQVQRTTCASVQPTCSEQLECVDDDEDRGSSQSLNQLDCDNFNFYVTLS